MGRAMCGESLRGSRTVLGSAVRTEVEERDSADMRVEKRGSPGRQERFMGIRCSMCCGADLPFLYQHCLRVPAFVSHARLVTTDRGAGCDRARGHTSSTRGGGMSKKAAEDALRRRRKRLEAMSKDEWDEAVRSFWLWFEKVRSWDEVQKIRRQKPSRS